MGDLLVGQPVPPREGGTGPVVGEQVPHRVGRVPVEQAEWTGVPLVALCPRDDVSHPVEQDGRRGLQTLQECPRGGAHRALRRCGDRLAQVLALAVFPGQPMQRHTVRVEPGRRLVLATGEAYVRPVRHKVGTEPRRSN